MRENEDRLYRIIGAVDVKYLCGMYELDRSSLSDIACYIFLYLCFSTGGNLARSLISGYAVANIGSMHGLAVTST